jgi:DNA-binding YbaB/EbfC family protein
MDMQKLMQQANAMQKKLKAIEEELEASVYDGENNGVRVILTGAHKVQSVEIPDDLMNQEDKEMLQDMIRLAFNQAVEKADADRQEKMGAITGGASIPGF